MTPHPHKDILIAIANGLPVTEVEVKHSTWNHWYNFEDYPYDIFKDPTSFEVRIKPKTLMFNGFELPEPVKETPKCGDLLYVPRPGHPDNCAKFNWLNSDYAKLALKKGLIHKTKEAAIAWSIAMTPIKNQPN